MCPNIVEFWFGIANGQISFLTEISAFDPPIFSFPDGNLSKYQWIFIKLGMCINIIRIWFGIANQKILSIFDSYLPETHPYFLFCTLI